jgi:hypothetical protein
MTKSKLAGLLIEAWNDMDRVVADLHPSEATNRASRRAGRG